MTLKFYYDLMSQPSRAIYIFLKVTGIKFEPKATKLGNRMLNLLIDVNFNL